MSLNERSIQVAKVQGPYPDLALHTIGWKLFQDLCAHTCEIILKRPIEVYRDAEDGGQDALFFTQQVDNNSTGIAAVQCKYTSTANRNLKPSDINVEEEEKIKALRASGHAETYVL